MAHQTNQYPKAKIQDSVQERQQTIECAGIYGEKAKDNEVCLVGVDPQFILNHPLAQLVEAGLTRFQCC